MELFPESFHPDHWLSKIDPRIKLPAAVLILIMILTHQGFAFPWIVAAVALFLLNRMRIPFQGLPYSESLSRCSLLSC